MTTAFHVVDGACSPDALLEARSLADAGGEGFLCVGPPSEDETTWKDILGADSVLATAPASALSARYSRRLAKLPGGDALACCWSVSAATRLAGAGLYPPGGMVVRLGDTPSEAQLGELARLARSHPLVIACRSPRLLDQVRQAGIGSDAEIVEPLPARRPRRPQPDDLREQLGVGAERFVLMAPGRVHRHSGHRYAAWATGIMKVAELPVMLIFEGIHRSVHDVAAFVDDTGVADFARIAPATMSLGELTAVADAAVFVGSEGLPTAALATAMSAGAPIVAADTPEGRDWLADGVNALLVAPDVPRHIARAFLRLIEDRSLAQRLGEQARASAARSFDKRKILRHWRKLHDELRAAVS